MNKRNQAKLRKLISKIFRQLANEKRQKHRRTSDKVSSKASKLLRARKTSAATKSVAASALVQRRKD